MIFRCVNEEIWYIENNLSVKHAFKFYSQVLDFKVQKKVGSHKFC